MTPLFSIEEFHNAKSRDLLPIKCKICSTTFYKTKHRLQQKTAHDFCSTHCKAQDQYKESIPYNCKECNKDFFIKPHKLRQHLNRKYKNFFCSYKCSGIFNAKNKTFGSSRSKMEIFLEEQLIKQYPSLTFICNSSNVIQAELDFFIPELNIAFEINGIFHYLPIFGKDKLEQTQTKDAFKIEQCEKNNIKLHVLDTSSFRYFKSKTASLVLEKICNIIDGEAKGN